ncbi:MAG: cobalamin-dependent protein [Nitrospirae bacterium YQR-1]
MAIKISFADLTHTNNVVATNAIPLGVAMVASYAKKVLGDEIEIELFKYPDDFSSYLQDSPPDIACFSTFYWNVSLANAFARRIKAHRPDTITVFGGPNFPRQEDEQREFLLKYPYIDFYVQGEGELAFVEVYKVLKENGFKAEQVKRTGESVPNTVYLNTDNHLVAGELLERINDLNIIPSPFTEGLLDKFFDEFLTPVIQTVRGCPYSCGFCTASAPYYNKLRSFSRERINSDLRYIAMRAKVPDLCIVDLNFGIFKGDLDTAKELALIKSQYNWPRSVSIQSAKNQKERIIEIANLFGDSINPGAPVQSTNDDVLRSIKRKNMSFEDIIKIAETSELHGADSFSELILCLPGDSKEAHFKSVFDICSTGIKLITSHQYMMLLGTESASKESRHHYAIESKFRIVPRCFGIYKLYGESFSIAEIEEICVANKTMPYEDYKECRRLNLTIDIFNNGGVFSELIQFIASLGLSRAEFFKLIYDNLHNNPLLPDLYNQFSAEEEGNLWSRLSEAESFVCGDGVVERYIAGELGNNEIYKYRTTCFVDYLEAISRHAFAMAKLLLQKSGADENCFLYLDELYRFNMLVKSDFRIAKPPAVERFLFDFVRMEESHFSGNFIDYYLPNGIDIEIYHSTEQREEIDGYIKQFGGSITELGRLRNRVRINNLYRKARYRV